MLTINSAILNNKNVKSKVRISKQKQRKKKNILLNGTF